MIVFSLIPARGGSKRVPKKNIKPLGGYPLIAYSIAASKLSKQIKRTIVSTDSLEIAEIAKRYGAEVPFLRPAKFAQDNSGDIDVFTHAIRWLEENQDSVPDLLVQLRPTTPIREPSVIDEAIDKIKANPKATSLRSAHQVDQPPQKMFQVGADGFWTGFFPDDLRPEYYNLPRQTFPVAYCPNGYVDVLRPDFIIKNPGQFSGADLFAFITPFIVDIDQVEDFEYAEYILQKQNSSIYTYLSNNFPKEK